MKGRRPEEVEEEKVYVIGRRNASDACQMCQSLFGYIPFQNFALFPSEVNDIEQKSLAKTYYMSQRILLILVGICASVSLLDNIMERKR